MGLIGDLALTVVGAPIKVISERKNTIDTVKYVNKNVNVLTVEQANKDDLANKKIRYETTMTFVSPDGEKVKRRVEIRRFFWDEKADTIFRGKAKVKNIDGSWKERTIYTYYPEIVDLETDKKLGPRVNPANGTIYNGQEYGLGLDGKAYYAYYPMCEVASGLACFDVDKKNPNSSQPTYGNNLVVEMERNPNGNMIVMPESGMEAYKQFEHQMYNDTMPNDKYMAQFIDIANYTYRDELIKIRKNMPSEYELNRMMKSSITQETSGKTEVAQQASIIDVEFMKKYNWRQYERLAYGIVEGPPMRPMGPPMGPHPGIHTPITR